MAALSVLADYISPSKQILAICLMYTNATYAPKPHLSPPGYFPVLKNRYMNVHEEGVWGVVILEFMPSLQGRKINITNYSISPIKKSLR